MTKNQAKERISLILEVSGLVVAAVALIVSCQANNISKSNEAKLLRLECSDKLDDSSRAIISSYRKIIPLMSSIFNNKDNLSSIGSIHTEFQDTGQNLLDSIDKFNNILRRYEARCPDLVSSSIDKARVAGLQIKDGELKDFVAFSPEVMQKHRENLDSMFKYNATELCCPKGN